MNYIELINQFWRQDAERPFQASDTRLYFYLLHTCNTLGWKNPFGHSDRHLALQVGASVNTIRKAKFRLIESGLIKVFTPLKPSNSIAGQSIYTLLTVSKTDTVNKVINPTVSKIDTVCDTVCDTNKLNQTEIKPNQTISISKKIKNEFPYLLDALKEKYLNVSKMEKQITLEEYNMLRTELQISVENISDILQRMENYKPLLDKNTSVYLTIKAWHKKDLTGGAQNSERYPNKNRTRGNNGITDEYRQRLANDLRDGISQAVSGSNVSKFEQTIRNGESGMNKAIENYRLKQQDHQQNQQEVIEKSMKRY